MSELLAALRRCLMPRPAEPMPAWNRTSRRRRVRDHAKRDPVIAPRGQFEIRPGVWAYEDGVPCEVLLPHLEQRGIVVRPVVHAAEPLLKVTHHSPA